MRLRPVGQSRLKLPPFGLGTAHLGELYARVPEAQSQATLLHAWDVGVRYFDTSPWYGRGLAEHRLGQFLRTRERASLQSTQRLAVCSPPRAASALRYRAMDWRPALRVIFDYSYDGVMRAYEQSLQRLALPHVDSLVIHDLDTKTHAPIALICTAASCLMRAACVRSPNCAAPAISMASALV